MTTTVDSPIADRGHGMSRSQWQEFAAIAHGRAEHLRGQGDEGRTPNAAVASLAAQGLVTYLPGSGWHLTYPTGYEAAERMGLIERPDPTEGSPGDLYDPPAAEHTNKTQGKDA